jgi:hypothetical protein
VATIADARLRHVKNPNDQNSYIPARVQTWCVLTSFLGVYFAVTYCLP